MKRNSFIATLLGFICPEFVYLWLGVGRMTIYVLAIEAAMLVFGVYLGGVYIGVAALGTTIVLAIILRILVAWDALRRSRTTVVLRWYNKVHYYILFFIGICFAQEVLTTYFRANYIEFFRASSGVLSPSIMLGDRIAVDKTIYRNHPLQRGDVVLMRHPDEIPGRFIFRVIGLPGEEIKLKSAKIFVNGVELAEPYASWRDGGASDGEFEAAIVPLGHYLVLGDNRDKARDSRFWTNRFVPKENIEGKAIYIYWSPGHFERIGMPISYSPINNK